MLTKLGEILRIIRENNDDGIKEMAHKLGISISYLSAIENGKRNIPNDLEEKLIYSYELSSNEIKRIEEAIADSLDSVKIDMSKLSEKQKRLIYALSKNELDEIVINKMYEVLEKGWKIK